MISVAKLTPLVLFANPGGGGAGISRVPLERTISGTARAEDLLWFEVAHAGDICMGGGFGMDDTKAVQKTHGSSIELVGLITHERADMIVREELGSSQAGN